MILKRGGALFLCVLLVVFQGCAISNNKNVNISEYGFWSDSTKNILDESFRQSLPNAQTVYDYGKMYYYNNPQSLLGDVNFIIIVDLQFDNEFNYKEEIDKYSTLFSKSSFEENGTTYYIIQGTEENVLGYLDKKIYDGMFYNFEIISTNRDDYTVSFINAHVWDYSSDQVLVERLRQIYKGALGDGSSVP